ncbi:TPA: hypothetical protein EYG96_03240 [Candidatus Gracilibacteria bacterium]|nr:hypothetical protein [Candidatus Peregrinibacteria bacterium]HIQ57029.1 hypothetical protein [Candidatus Gracilibacteria bacterium]HIQ57246.1 hypothetical protein [Candidatus Gracilibacteria bacterium]
MTETQKLSDKNLALIAAFSKACRGSIIEMVAKAKSGHPGGSLSNLDFFSVLYTQIISQTGEKCVVSNGHIAPAIYAVLAEMGYIDKQEVLNTLRQPNSVFEGHVNRHVTGIPVGTGPLGAGVSMAAGVAVAAQKDFLNATDEDQYLEMVFATIGDGEAQEGQVYETFLFAAQEKLNNFCVFVDYNQVQLTGSLEDTININVAEIGKACGWNVIEIDGHNHQEISDALTNASEQEEKPTLIVGKTVMGYGVEFMAKDGRDLKSSWHGKAPSLDDVKNALEQPELKLTEEEIEILEKFRTEEITWFPQKNIFIENLTPLNYIDAGTPIVYEADVLTDCRSAYGKALLDISKKNKEILTLSADLQGSVMTKFVAQELPEQHIEVGIAEQNLVSCSGGISLSGYIPFCSTFAAFMGSRAKDQARLNDINRCNVKMVATHAGLSAGPDGPTHQAIEDAGSFLGMFNTNICEPADPNHCDRIIRYVGTHYGNFYVRMGRHKLPVLTKENGDIFFDAEYKYEYGKCEILRSADNNCQEKIVIVAIGGTAIEALRAREKSDKSKHIEIIIVSSIKQFDETLVQSLKTAQKIITVEDHNSRSGLSSAIKNICVENKICPEYFETCAVDAYQLSGNDRELYAAAGIDADGILGKI